jgi:hypothetical protein
LAILSAGHLVAWAWWRNGTVMATSRNLDLPAHPTVIVRELPTSSPFWAVPLQALDDNYLYRAEYYAFSSPQIFSCLTYSGRSYKANSARIEWGENGTVTVFLDDNPKVKCDKEGIWEIAKD